MDKSNDGLRNPYIKLKEIFEQCRGFDLSLDEEKLMQELLIFAMQLEHGAWFLGYNRGLSQAHKMWFAGIMSGTIVVNNRRCLHDPSDNIYQIRYNSERKKT